MPSCRKGLPTRPTHTHAHMHARTHACMPMYPRSRQPRPLARLSLSPQGGDLLPPMRPAIPQSLCERTASWWGRRRRMVRRRDWRGRDLAAPIGPRRAARDMTYEGVRYAHADPTPGGDILAIYGGERTSRRPKRASAPASTRPVRPGVGAPGARRCRRSRTDSTSICYSSFWYYASYAFGWSCHV